MSKNKIMEEKIMSIQEIVVSRGIETPTLRAFAETVGVSVNRLYVASKKPIVGAIYDPEAINWDAVEAILTAKFGDGIDTMEQLVDGAIAKAEEIAASSKRSVIADKTARKSSKMNMGSEDESFLCFKKDPAVYKMVYQTAGFTCIRPVDADGNFIGEEVKVLSNNTMNTKIVPVFSLASAIAERFNGTYGATEENTTDTTTEAE